MQRHCTSSMDKARSTNAGARVAHRANSSVRSSSRDSFSAAACLVIKPCTPPKMPKPCTPPKLSAQRFNSTCSQRPAEDVSFVAPGDGSQGEAMTVPIEVVSLAGNPVIKGEFLLADKVLAVKRQIQSAAGHQIFQQQLAWQGCLLENDSTLQAHGFSSQGAVVQLMLKSLPDQAELEGPKAIKNLGLAAIEHFALGAPVRRHRDIVELSALKVPPGLCETVCGAVVYLLAGVEPSINLKRNGSPSPATWTVCVEMMRSGSFLKSLNELPDFIDRGKCLPRNVRAAKELMQMVPGATNDEKVTAVSRCSTAASRFCGWALCMIEYFEAADRKSVV